MKDFNFTTTAYAHRGVNVCIPEDVYTLNRNRRGLGLVQVLHGPHQWGCGLVAVIDLQTGEQYPADPKTLHRPTREEWAAMKRRDNP